MRRFNTEKELRKIQHGNKNKIIIGVVALLIILGISSSYALYQVRYSKRIIYTKVAPFSNKDIQLAIYLDGEPSSTNDFPKKNSGYKYDHIDCDNNSTAKFDTGTWQLILRARTKDKCNVYFVKEEEGIPNVPELYQGLIPVVYDASGNISVADTTTDWYNYDEKRWANAVLVDSSNYSKYVKNGEYISNKTIPMTEILQMYVWIPRYKYQLFNVDNGNIDPMEIQIQFENNTSTTGTVSCTNEKGKEKCTGATKGAWYTHPAFKFGDTDLTGIWVGKFESSGNNTNLKIVPNVSPLTNVNVSYIFNATRNIEKIYATNFNLKKEEIDTHLMKNMDWGAMAYLTHSKYGRCTTDKCEEVSIASEGTTGYSSGAWNTTNGVLSSTTKNMYGVYDTNGGKWEYVMATMVDANGEFNLSSAGFSVLPNSKYYELYEHDSKSEHTHQRGHLGDATREILKIFGNSTGSWYNDYANMPGVPDYWFIRGGRGGDGSAAGTYAFGTHVGQNNTMDSFRVVITAQDGVDEEE